jgi:cell division septal protein FtsQ
MQLKVYRRDNRKSDKKRWRRLLLRAAVVGAFLVLGVALYHLSGPLTIAYRSVCDFIVENSYFSVREIQVHGGEKVGGNEIAAVAGLRQGMNIWKVDAAAIEMKIAKHPWVRRVVVRRDFPRRIVIDVEERTPKAIVAARQLYYIDADGVIFKQVDPGESVKFPMLTGISAETLIIGDMATRKRIQEALRLADLMARRSYTLSEIHFDAPERLVVYTTKFPVALRMGWGDWDVKLAHLDQLLALWKGNEERLVSLDMAFRDQVVARLKTVQQ